MPVRGRRYFGGSGRPAPALEALEGRLTPAAPFLVKDIDPYGSSFPDTFAVAGGNAYFWAWDQTQGNGLWRTDGTANGTALVADTGPYSPQRMTAAGSTLFFNRDDGIHGTELWKSDGTATGMVMVKDINTRPNPNNPSENEDGLPNLSTTELVAVGNEVYFNGDDGVHGTELWKSDGTAAGTVMVKDINPGGASAGAWGPLGITADPNGGFYFSADDGTHGYELWHSDGTDTGTEMIADINPGSAGSDPFDFVSFNGATYFSAYGEVWKTDGTAAGTVRVSDPAPNIVSGWDPSYLTAVNGALFYVAHDPTHGYELWKTDGTTAGTAMLADINPGTADSRPSRLIALNNKLLFDANDGIHGDELWTSDGTTVGTAMLADIDPGSSGSYADYPAVVGGYVCFMAWDDSNERSLWQTDGTPAGTQRVHGFSPPGSAQGAFEFAKLGGTVLFPGYDAATGYELWEYQPGPLGGGPPPTSQSVTARVSGTTLFLTGNDDANRLGLHVDAAGHVVVTSSAGSIGGKGGTAANGVFTTSSTGITSIHIALKGGDDTVVNDTPDSGAGAFSFTGTLFVDLGAGTNALDLAAPTAGAGPVTLGGLTVRAAAGSTTVSVGGGSGPARNRVPRIGVRVAGGAADVRLTNLVAGTVSLKAATGLTVALAGDVADALSAAGGAGAVSLAGDLWTTGDVAVSGGAVQLTDAAGTPSALSIGGDLKLSAKTTATLGLNNPGSAVSVGGGLTVKAAAVAVTNTAAPGLTVRGGATLNGKQTVVADLGGAQLGGLKVTGGATSGNRITTAAGFWTPATTGAVSITTAGGSSVDLAGSIGGPLTVKGGGGADRLTLSGVEVAAPAKVLTGGGDDTLTVGAGTKLDGTFFVDQGAGNDTFALNTDPNHPTDFAGVVTVKQGADSDTVTGLAGTANGNTFEAAGNTFDGGTGSDTAGAANLSAADPKFLNYEG
jgi:ELWxxDGT repeat protein